MNYMNQNYYREWCHSRNWKFSSDDIKSDELLYSELRRLGFKNQYQLRLLMLASNTKETQKCVVCGGDYKTRLSRHTDGTICLQKTCSKSCNMILRHSEPNYSKNIAEKIKTNINTIGDDGLSRGQRWARDIAERKKTDAAFALLVSTNIQNGLLSGGSVEDVFLTRLRSQKRDIKKTFLRWFRLGRKYISYDHFKLKYEYMNNNGFSQFDTPQLDFISMLEPNLKICPRCANSFSAWRIVDEKPEKYTLSAYCQKSCAIADAYADPMLRLEQSIRNKRRYETAESRILQSIRSTAVHAEKQIEERKLWSIKMLQTLGDLGIKARQKKATQTKYDRGDIAYVTDSNIHEYVGYRRKVHQLQKKNNLSILENFENRGRTQYHLDHIFPVSQGFIYGIPPELIGDIRNLRMLDYVANIKKSNKIPTEIPQHIMEFLNEHKINISRTL